MHRVRVRAGGTNRLDLSQQEGRERSTNLVQINIAEDNCVPMLFMMALDRGRETIPIETDQNRKHLMGPTKDRQFDGFKALRKNPHTTPIWLARCKNLRGILETITGEAAVGPIEIGGAHWKALEALFRIRMHAVVPIGNPKQDPFIYKSEAPWDIQAFGLVTGEHVDLLTNPSGVLSDKNYDLCETHLTIDYGRCRGCHPRATKRIRMTDVTE